MTEKTTKLQQVKIDAVADLKKAFGDAKDFIFTDYRGLTVEQISELRKRLRNEKAVYKVVKNRFAKIALKELKHPDVSKHLVGPTAVAMTVGDSGAVAKILLEYSKESPMKLKGGLIEGPVFDGAQVEAFSRLPSRRELIAKLLGTMKAPIQNSVCILNAIPSKLVRTLAAVAEKKEQSA